MADFISGQDLVARGAEGTGAAVVLDNRPTIQSLARLGGRMDNLYKTQEMLKLKLAAAKAEQAKPPKQPNLNPYATGGVIGENLGAIGNTFMQGISAIKGARYNQKVAANDITGANQEAADAASVLATLNPVVGNTDKVVKSFLDEHKEYYDLTPQKTQEIIARFPSINQQELSKITDPAEQEKYIMGKYNQFLQTDANKILRDATVYDPRSYDYNKIFTVINKNLSTRTEDIKKAGGTGYTNISSELFKIIPGKPIELNYNKALSAIDQLPKAREQVEVLQALAVNKAKETDIYKNLAEDKKESALDFIKENTAKKYADKVFAIGLPLEQRRDFESTRAKAEAEAKGKGMGEEKEDKVYTGAFNFNYQGSVFSYDKDKNRVQRPVDYTIESVGAAVADEKWTVPPNSVFVPLGQLSSNDVAALRANKFKSRTPNAVNNMWVQNTAGETQSAARVKMPMFVNSYTDPDDPSINYNAGDFVPKDLLAKKTRYPSGEEVRVLDPDNYMLVTGHVANPKVKIEIGKDAMLNPMYDEQATTQNFYMDQSSFQTLQKEIERRENKKGTIFSGFSGTK